MDTLAIEKAGYEPLKPVLHKIDALNNYQELLNFLTENNWRYGVGILRFSIGPDQSNSTKNIMLIPLDLTTQMVFTDADMENCFKNINHATKEEFMRALTKFTTGTNTMFRETAYDK